MAVCSQCNKAVLPHTACSHCGYYKGKQVLKAKKSKVEKFKAKKQ